MGRKSAPRSQDERDRDSRAAKDAVHKAYNIKVSVRDDRREDNVDDHWWMRYMLSWYFTNNGVSGLRSSAGSGEQNKGWWCVIICRHVHGANVVCTTG
jgi:hypothetical protein